MQGFPLGVLDQEDLALQGDVTDAFGVEVVERGPRVTSQVFDFSGVGVGSHPDDETFLGFEGIHDSGSRMTVLVESDEGAETS